MTGLLDKTPLIGQYCRLLPTSVMGCLHVWHF